MAISTCNRCGRQTVKLEPCGSCNKLLCVRCIKSSKRLKGKIRRLFICKSCWCNMKLRKKYKSA